MHCDSIHSDLEISYDLSGNCYPAAATVGFATFTANLP